MRDYYYESHEITDAECELISEKAITVDDAASADDIPVAEVVSAMERNGYTIPQYKVIALYLSRESTGHEDAQDEPHLRRYTFIIDVENAHVKLSHIIEKYCVTFLGHSIFWRGYVGGKEFVDVCCSSKGTSEEGCSFQTKITYVKDWKKLLEKYGGRIHFFDVAFRDDELRAREESKQYTFEDAVKLYYIDRLKITEEEKSIICNAEHDQEHE